MSNDSSTVSVLTMTHIFLKRHPAYLRGYNNDLVEVKHNTDTPGTSMEPMGRESPLPPLRRPPGIL
jgi:hypothetical protein